MHSASWEQVLLFCVTLNCVPRHNRQSFYLPAGILALGKPVSIYINEQKRMGGPETAPHVGTALVRRTSVCDPLNLERDHLTAAYTSPTPRKAARSVSRRP